MVFEVNTYSLGPDTEERKCRYRIVFASKEKRGPFHILRHTLCNKVFSFAELLSLRFLTSVISPFVLYFHGTG